MYLHSTVYEVTSLETSTGMVLQVVRRLPFGLSLIPYWDGEAADLYSVGTRNPSDERASALRSDQSRDRHIHPPLQAGIRRNSVTSGEMGERGGRENSRGLGVWS